MSYNQKRWSDNWREKDRSLYQSLATAHHTVAHFQDWLAVKILCEHKIVNKDAIFVPGHSGDFIAGSHIPKIAFEKSEFRLEDVVDAIFDRHYKEMPMEFIGIDRSVWNQRIIERLSSSKVHNQFDFADLIENWDWRERQSKYINNSVRVYEHFGFDWWMPFWDKDFLDFWMKVPLQLRKGRKWYIEYVQEKYKKQVPKLDRVLTNNASDRNWFLLKFLSGEIGKRIKNNKFVRNCYFSFIPSVGIGDPLQGIGGYSDEVYRDKIVSGMTTVGLLSKQYTDDFLNRDKI